MADGASLRESSKEMVKENETDFRLKWKLVTQFMEKYKERREAKRQKPGAGF